MPRCNVPLCRGFIPNECVSMQILPMLSEAKSTASTITYDAADLMWDDGLDAIREIDTSAQMLHNAQDKLPIKWRCSTADEMQWYCHWKGLSGCDHQFTELPKVFLSDLLWQLGVPEEQIDVMATNVGRAVLPAIYQAVLPDFVAEAVGYMADQLPELQLVDKLNHTLLFTG